jgi:hypothetical protein
MITGLKTAVIPVEMRWGAMPLASLVEAMDAVTSKRTYRTDRPADERDGLKVDPLFFEFLI